MPGPTQGKGAQVAQQVTQEQANAQAMMQAALAQSKAKESEALAYLNNLVQTTKSNAEVERAQLEARSAQVESKVKPLLARAKAMEQQEKAAAKAAEGKAKPLPMPEVRPLNMKNPSAPVIQSGASFAPGPEGAVGGAAAQQVLQGMQGGQPQSMGGGQPGSVNIAGQNFAVPSMIASGRVQSETGAQEISPGVRVPQTTTRTSIDLEPNVLKAFEAARLLQEQQESNRRLDLMAQATASAMIRDFGDTFHSKDWGAAFSLSRAYASGDWQGVDSALGRMGKTLPEEKQAAFLAAQRASIAESAARIRHADAATVRERLGAMREAQAMRLAESGGQPDGKVSLWDIANPGRPRQAKRDRLGNVTYSEPEGVLSYKDSLAAWGRAFDTKGELVAGKAAALGPVVDSLAFHGFLPTRGKSGWIGSAEDSMQPIDLLVQTMDRALAGDAKSKDLLVEWGLVSDFGRNGDSPQPVGAGHPNVYASQWFNAAYRAFLDWRVAAGPGEVEAAPPVFVAQGVVPPVGRIPTDKPLSAEGQQALSVSEFRERARRERADVKASEFFRRNDLLPVR